MSEPLAIAFQGAARTVTGSRHRVRLGARSWLFDCGLSQGHRDEAEAINRTFAFEPAELTDVVVSHAHLDHTGSLPTLVARGYPGRIHATGATTDLAAVLLQDSAFLMERDVEHVNRRRRPHQPPRRPLYTRADVARTVERFVEHDYHAPWRLHPEIDVTFFDAGHILGSALTVFEISSGGRRFRLGMSGDLGRRDRPILRDPETPPGVDALVLESTYGDRLHPDPEDNERRLTEVIERTAARGGRLLVPAFAVGRTQELVATIHTLCEQKRLCDLPIFVDSPMARQATEVFRRHPECFDAETHRRFESEDGAPFGFRRLRYVASVEESKSLNDRREPCIIISASGMCEGGRILHHLQNGLGDARNTVLFVGFQAEHTLGRRLVEGAETVSIFGEPVRRRAEIVALEGFSAHADQRDLVQWAAGLEPSPRAIFLVHGELAPAETLQARLRERINAAVHIPRPGEEFALWN